MNRLIFIIILFCSCYGNKTENQFISLKQNIWYYQNSRISNIAEFNKQGQLNGCNITFTEDGVIKEIEYYINDSLHRERLVFYENGTLKLKSTYKNGKEVGVRYTYHKNGILEGELVYESDTFTGYMREYNKNGKQQFIHCAINTNDDNSYCKKIR
jgi:antitoxin component YwqK of YwqJK toxin-antitoxin module